MFQSLKEKLGALKKKLMGDTEESGHSPEATEEPKVFQKKAKAAARAADAQDAGKIAPDVKQTSISPPGDPENGKIPMMKKSLDSAQDTPRNILRDEKMAAKKTAEPAVLEEKKGFFSGLFGKSATTRPAPGPEEKREPFTDGFLGWKLTEGKIDEILWDLEMALLESDVAMPVIDAIKKSVKTDLVDRKVKFGTVVEGVVEEALKKAIRSVLSENITLGPKARKNPSRFIPSDFDLFIEKHEKPVVVMCVGINGTGKTTTIAKMVHRLLKRGFSCVIGAGDTFRAGAIEQLEKHAEKLGVKLIKHQAGSDPASVAFDAIEHARARKRDVVFIDTAGRMQTDTGLMDEMSKIERVANPGLVIYVGDALAGNDAVNEAVAFNKAVGIDAVVLTKVDADAKGGAALSIRYATGAPVIFVGTGQEYDHLEKFTPDWMVDRIFGGDETPQPK